MLSAFGLGVSAFVIVGLVSGFVIVGVAVKTLTLPHFAIVGLEVTVYRTSSACSFCFRPWDPCQFAWGTLAGQGARQVSMCGLLPENLGHGVLRVVAVVRYGRRLCALRACRATAPLWVLGAPPVPTAREALESLEPCRRTNGSIRLGAWGVLGRSRLPNLLPTLT